MSGPGTLSFDPKTGAHLLWYWRSEKDEYEFFDGPGFHPRTGEALKAATKEALHTYELEIQERTKQLEAEKARIEAEQKTRRAEEERSRLEQQRKAERDEKERAEELRRLTEAARRCDELAANPNDPRRVGEGVPYEALKPQAAAAVKACELALKQNPNELRFKYQLGRALELTDVSCTESPSGGSQVLPPGTRAEISKNPYTVDGVALGGRVRLDTPDYGEYQCRPSDQFAGFTWCQRERQKTERRGIYNSTNTILHTKDGTAVYANRFIQPAFWDSNEMHDDIGKIERKYGEKPRIIEMPQRPGLPNAMIALWGKLQLEPLDAESLSKVASGGSPRKGILVDFLGDFAKSGRSGLPVYRVTGSTGFLWSASFDPAGRGHLRFLAVDASALVPGFAADAQPQYVACQENGRQRAFHIHQELVAQGYPAAFDNLGSLYRWDKKDFGRAVVLFRQGIRVGDTDSMLSLADMIERGQATPVNANETPIELYRRAADLGNQSAIHAYQAEFAKQDKAQQEQVRQLEQQRMMLQFMGNIIQNLRH